MANRHNTIQEGIFAGFLSATVIAVWLLIVDTIAGHPFFTPMVLGRGLIGVFGALKPSDTDFLYISVYTVFHYAAFALIGIFVASVVHIARRTPGILGGFLVLFVAFEIGFYGFTGMLSVSSSLKDLAWIQIMLANLIAAAVMLIYMWRRHPELKRELISALEGTDA